MKISEDYKADSFLIKIFKYLMFNWLNLENSDKAVKKQLKIIFIICKNLLSYKKADTDYLLIFAIIKNKIFKLIHNKDSYIKLY